MTSEKRGRPGAGSGHVETKWDYGRPCPISGLHAAHGDGDGACV